MASVEAAGYMEITGKFGIASWRAEIPMASNSDSSDPVPFWRRKSLREMTDSEWESLCDGCGRCCLNKLEDDESAAVTFYTDVGCRLLDGHSCRCRD
jgi:hypothetical protein